MSKILPRILTPEVVNFKRVRKYFLFYRLLPYSIRDKIFTQLHTGIFLFYLLLVCMCVSTHIHVPWHTCRGQKTTPVFHLVEAVSSLMLLCWTLQVSRFESSWVFHFFCLLSGHRDAGITDVCLLLHPASATQVPGVKLRTTGLNGKSSLPSEPPCWTPQLYFRITFLGTSSIVASPSMSRSKPFLKSALQH